MSIKIEMILECDECGESLDGTVYMDGTINVKPCEKCLRTAVQQAEDAIIK
jgi:ribosomal protein L37AE/L43A